MHGAFGQLPQLLLLLRAEAGIAQRAKAAMAMVRIFFFMSLLIVYLERLIKVLSTISIEIR